VKLVRSINDLAHHDLSRFAAYCEELAQAQDLPSIAMFRSDDVSWLTAHMFDLNVSVDEQNYGVLWCGDAITLMSDSDFTGGSAHEMESLTCLSGLCRDCDMVVRARRAHFLSGMLLWPDSEQVSCQRLLVPFCGVDESITHILGAIHLEIAAEEVARFRRAQPTFSRDIAIIPWSAPDLCCLY
jgi:hypothetical protein